MANSEVALNEMKDEYVIKLSDFNYEKTLCSLTWKKVICVKGTLSKEKGIAIFFFERTPFGFTTLKDFCIDGCSLEKESVVGTRTNYLCFPGINKNGLKMMLIFPATKKHIQKYESCQSHVIEETPELYENVVLPFIKRESFNLQWIYNIFDHEAETERIIYEDTTSKTGFIFIPDIKWDKKRIDNLYMLAIIRRRDIKSLRDLHSEHLPLLKNINDKGSQIIQELFGLSKNRLRIYLHYQPSYYHLHVHFTNIDYRAPGIHAAKAHPLESVIKNITLIPDYYQRATLSYMLKETDGLYKAININDV